MEIESNLQKPTGHVTRIKLTKRNTLIYLFRIGGVLALEEGWPYLS